MRHQESKQVFVNELSPPKAVEWQKSSDKFPIMLFLSRGVITLFFLFILNLLSVIAYFVGEVHEIMGSYPIWVPFVSLIVLVPVFWITAFEHRYRGYSIGDTEIRFKRGVIHRAENVMPYGRIQHVVSRQGLFHRFFGLALLEIHTAGQFGSYIDIDGLEKELVDELRPFIMKRVSQITGKSLSDELSLKAS